MLAILFNYSPTLDYNRPRRIKSSETLYITQPGGGMAIEKSRSEDRVYVKTNNAKMETEKPGPL